MKFLFRLALLCSSLAGAALAGPGDDAIAAVLAADQARGAALLAADTAALDRLLADDLRYTHSSGKVETKAVHLKSFADGLRYDRFETTGLHGHAVTPEVVVLTGTINQNKGVGGKMTALRLFFHAVWRKGPQGWQLASLQTALPPPQN